MNHWDSLSSGKKIAFLANFFVAGYILGWKVPFSTLTLEVVIVLVLALVSAFSFILVSRLSLLVEAVASAGGLFLVGSDLLSKYLYQQLGTSTLAWYVFYLPAAISCVAFAALQIAYVFKAVLTKQGKSNVTELRPQQMPIKQENTPTANVYLRNTGKCKLEINDGVITFYVEKGFLSKKKENVKEIPIIEATEFSLEGKEIGFFWKETIEHVVFENPDIAKQFFENIKNTPPETDVQIETPAPVVEPSNLLEQTQQQVEEQIPQQTEAQIQVQTEPIAPTEQPPLSTPQPLVQPEPAQQENPIQNAYALVRNHLPAIDAIFDVLINLNGKINWNSIGAAIEKLKAATQQTKSQNLAPITSQTIGLEEAYKKGNVESMLKEAYSILQLIDKSFEALAAEKPNGSTPKIDPAIAKITAKSYFVLNDIILGKIVRDQALDDEMNQFKKEFESLAQINGAKADSTEILTMLKEIDPNAVTPQKILDCRSAFSKQLQPN